MPALSNVSMSTKKVITGQMTKSSYNAPSMIMCKRKSLHTSNSWTSSRKNVENDDIVWKFQRIVVHQGHLKPNNPNYMGSHFNVRIKWENGEITYEPLDVIAANDPITCAIYMRENSLLDELGWIRFWCLANREKHSLHLVKQAKMQSFKAAPHYKFGYPVPHTYDEAL